MEDEDIINVVEQVLECKNPSCSSKFAVYWHDKQKLRTKFTQNDEVQPSPKWKYHSHNHSFSFFAGILLFPVKPKMANYLYAVLMK